MKTDQHGCCSILNPGRATATRRVIAFVAAVTDALDVAATFEVLSLASDRGEPAYRVELLSLDGGRVSTTAGIEILSDAARAAESRDIDTIVITAASPPDTAEARTWLDEAKARRVLAIGRGVFLLAELSLLDGRNATVHWSHRENSLARQVPCSPAARL
jgi:transcriptional regulator GlxA family with amidase domain